MQTRASFCLAVLLSAGAADAALAPADRGVGPAYEPANYDAKFDGSLRDQHFQLSKIQQTLRAQRLAALQGAPRNGFPSEIDALTATPRVLWAGADRKPAAVAPLATEKAIAEARARDFLRRQAGVLGVDADTLSQAELIDAQSPKSGPVIARFRQMYAGTEVFNQRLNVAMDHAGQLVAVTGGFAVDIDHVASSKLTRKLDGAAALATAFADLGGAANSAFVAKGTRAGYTKYRASSVAGDLQVSGDSRVKPVYFTVGNQLVPAYYLELSTESRNGKRQLDYGYVVSATDGAVLFRKNQRQYDGFSYRVFADGSDKNQPFDAPLGNGYTPYQGSDIYAAQTRTSAVANLITLDHAPMLSTGDPWLASGATVTSGNNVNAYLDLVSPNGYQARRGDLQPTITGTGVFDYPIVADADPKTADSQKAAAVNLFYLNNWLHDFWYDHGFDEASGNAQKSNYGRGGVEGDAIEAQGQDYSGTNNANMSTPADGGAPRMQMYLFDGPVNGDVSVTIAPATDPTSVAFGVASFGPSVYQITGSLVLVADDTSPVTDACTDLVNGSAVAGNIAVIDRGGCSFQSKAAKAEAAGAIGVIIVDNVSEGTIAMAGDDAAPTVNIPTVSITLADGTTIKDALAGGAAVTASLKRDTSIQEDGTLDNQVISHEFFHYVSNRLVGDGSGLSNNQGGGMGEGWSDFDSMLLTVRPEDISITGNAQYASAYPVGFYVIVPSYYFGIRRTPYSTDFAIDPLTFQHIQNGVVLPTTAPLAFGANGASNAEVHNTGEIWTNMLWEGYAALLNSGYYSFDEARSRMQDYVIGGLKLTPNAPTFVDARDGVVAAAAASSCVDANLISAAFAKRGIGADAVAPPSSSTDNKGVVEDYTPAVINCPPAANAGADQTVDISTLVTLDGSASSDSNGDKLSYSWTETSGPTVTLSDATTSKPTFTPTEAGSYVFDLTVTDAAGVTSTDSVTITVVIPNYAPVADAGPDQSAVTGDSVALNGSGSTDANGDTLSYSWAETSGPEVALSDSTSAVPTFTPTAAGTYVFELTVTDPAGASSTDTVTITVKAANVAPVANAGSDQAAFTGDLVTLDGSSSSDENGDTLTYAWTEASGPSATLANADAARPTFTPGEAGVYVFLLTVTDPSGASSTDTVTITVTVPNYAPVANAGVDQSALIGDVVTLDGSASTDANGDTLSYVWVQNSGPTARLSSDTAAKPTFTPAGAGTYVFQLTVTDPSGASSTDTVTITVTAPNYPPVANAGVDQSTVAGAVVTLDGSASTDANGDTLSYAWKETSGTAVTLSSATVAKPTFTPSAAGSYVFQLTVTDPSGASSSDSVTVTVSASTNSGGTSTSSSSGGGGAMGGTTLIGLLAAAALRRRKRG